MAYVRWSELEIDPARLDSFRNIAEENVRDTRRNEPGVLAFYWAGERDRPSHVRVVEVYADEDAYQVHLQSPHYQKFRAGSAHLVMAHRLFEGVPVKLGAKPQLPPADAVVRIAEIVIDAAQLDAYKAVVGEEIDASIRSEPGVFAIYAFALKDSPAHLRFYEIYADDRAYALHRESPHFKKYLGATQGMIKSLTLIETAPALPSR